MGFWNFFGFFNNDTSFHVTSSDDYLSPIRDDDDKEPFPYSDTDSSFGTGSIFEDSFSTTSSDTFGSDSFSSIGSDTFGSDSSSSGTGFDGF